jgi:hypothetical protein
MDIEVNITDGTASVSQESFGIVKVLSEEEQYKALKVGTGKSRLIFVSADRGGDANIVIVQTGSSIIMAAASTTVTLTIPTTGATAKEVKAYFDANTLAPVKALIDLKLDSSGTGPVAIMSSTALAAITDFTLLTSNDVSNLLPYYAEDDQTYLMAVQLFSQELAPEKVYVQDGFRESGNDDTFTEIIEVSDNTDFYFLLLTDTSIVRAEEAATWADLNKKLLVVLAVSTDVAVLDNLETNGYSAVVIATSANMDTRPDAAAVGAQASKTPGSTDWDWLRLVGVTAETDTALISTVQTEHGNIVVKKSGITFFGPGRMTNGLFIDQRHSRDYMEARIKEAFISLLVSVEKIPYDDSGISTIISTLSDTLNSFGDVGIIARALSETETAASFNGRYQYSIDAPSRAEMVASAPNDVLNRIYPISFNFVEAGAIGDVNITGRVVLKLAA